MYIHRLPYEEWKQLCIILDRNNRWEELGGTYMKYDVDTLEAIRNVKFTGGSPTAGLLTEWGSQNHTVFELFILLGRMKHYQAMTVIKNLIGEKYHYLIKSDDELNNLMHDLHVDHKNQQIIHDDSQMLNAPKVILKPLIIGGEKENLKPTEIPAGQQLPPPLGKSKNVVASDISSVAESAGAIPSISYMELEKATNNWDENAVLGRGGFGKVFKGTWKCTQVAIKRFELKEMKPEYESEQIKQSITELHCLNAYRHDNVLPLYGYSIGGPHPCVIYQYMAGGSLDVRLRVRDMDKVLKWPTRLGIATGVARGLQFLHTNMINNKPLVHGDIKCANILLDPNDQPKIGDFGLAREGPQSQYTYIKVSRIHGTRPYLPDEFLRAKKFSTKVDTYSFGVVLFEIATSLAPYSDKREDKFLKDHVVNYQADILELKDKRLPGYNECFRGMVELGKMCVRTRAKERPEMVSVLILLEGMSLKE